MIEKHLLAAGLSQVLAIGIGHVAEPLNATALQKYVSDEQKGENYSRLRISVASDLSKAQNAVRVGNVILCNASNECFRGTTTSFVDIHNTVKGEASTVLDVLIPPSTVTDVYFSEPVSGNGIRGHLKLQTPMVIDKEFYGSELFISLKRSIDADRAAFLPVEAAQTYFRVENQIVHYMPVTQTTAKLPLGAVLTIPAGALKTAQIFNVRVRSVGNLYPEISIFPEITNLAKVVTIEANAITGGVSALDSIAPARVSGETTAAIRTTNATGPKIVLKTSGPVSNITPADFENVAEGRAALKSHASADASGPAH